MPSDATPYTYGVQSSQSVRTGTLFPLESPRERENPVRLERQGTEGPMTETTRKRGQTADPAGSPWGQSGGQVTTCNEHKITSTRCNPTTVHPSLHGKVYQIR